MKSATIMRVCQRIEARYHARDAGQDGWWTPLLGRVMHDEVIAVSGPWPLQRHVLAHLMADLGVEAAATLRGPTLLLEEVVEETLTARARLSREQSWARHASATIASPTIGAKLQVRCVDEFMGVELEAFARWCFGMKILHPDVEIDVLMGDSGISLIALDGRTTPPTRTAVRLQHGQLCSESDNDLIDDHT